MGQCGCRQCGCNEKEVDISSQVEVKSLPTSTLYTDTSPRKKAKDTSSEVFLLPKLTTKEKSVKVETEKGEYWG